MNYNTIEGENYENKKIYGKTCTKNKCTKF